MQTRNATHNLIRFNITSLIISSVANISNGMYSENVLLNILLNKENFIFVVFYSIFVLYLKFININIINQFKKLIINARIRKT